jgi:hypothetical protein
MATNNYLRQLAEEYLEKGHSRGYTSEMLYKAIQEILSKENRKLKQNDLDEEEKEKLYQDLMVKALIKNNVLTASKTKDQTLRKTAGILYVIHKKEYYDTEGFIMRIAEHEKIKVESAREKMISSFPGNLFLGIAILVKENADPTVWTKRNAFDQRRECLEKIEEQLFEEIKEEYTRRGGCN